MDYHHGGGLPGDAWANPPGWTSSLTTSDARSLTPELGDAAEGIAETRQYLDDAQALLQTEKTAVDFFNAKLERYPNHLGRYVLWAGAQTLYGVPEHPQEDPRKISVASWL